MHCADLGESFPTSITHLLAKLKIWLRYSREQALSSLPDRADEQRCVEVGPPSQEALQVPQSSHSPNSQLCGCFVLQNLLSTLHASTVLMAPGTSASLFSFTGASFNSKRRFKYCFGQIANVCLFLISTNERENLIFWHLRFGDDIDVRTYRNEKN